MYYFYTFEGGYLCSITINITKYPNIWQFVRVISEESQVDRYEEVYRIVLTIQNYKTLRDLLTSMSQEAPDSHAVSAPIHVSSKSEYEGLISPTDIAVIDFFATWCGPCHMIEPVLESIAADTQATVIKVDIDEHRELAASFRVQSVPTLLVVVDGEVRERLVGVQSESDLRSVIQTHQPRS